MIDTRPYLEQIRRLFIDVLWANPCARSEEWLSRLYSGVSMADAFPADMDCDPKKLIRQSYEWARHAKNKRRPTLIDVTRLRFYMIPNQMYRDELELTGQKAVDGKANLIVRPAAQLAARRASLVVEESASLSLEEKGYWASTMNVASGEYCGE